MLICIQPVFNTLILAVLAVFIADAVGDILENGFLTREYKSIETFVSIKMNDSGLSAKSLLTRSRMSSYVFRADFWIIPNPLNVRNDISGGHCSFCAFECNTFENFDILHMVLYSCYKVCLFLM